MNRWKKFRQRFRPLDCRHEAGFTLVELIVVIAVMAILGGVGTAGYSGYIKSANKGADKTLVGNVMRAIETGTNSTMFVSEDSFVKGATTYPVGVIILTTDEDAGCSVMASTSERGTTSSNCTLVNANGAQDVPFVAKVEYKETVKSKKKVLGLLSYDYKKVDVYSVTLSYPQYCSAHSILPSQQSIVTEATAEDYSVKTTTVNHYLLSDCTGMYALVTDHVEGGSVTTGTLTSTAGQDESRVQVTTDSPIYKSLTAAFGSDLSALTLKYDGWGKEGDEHTYATLLAYSDNMISNIKGTADTLLLTNTMLGGAIDSYLSESYEDTADMMDSFANYVIALYPEKSLWNARWNLAAESGIDYAFGFPYAIGTNSYHNDYVYAATKAYNSGFAAYCRANGVTNTDALGLIENFSGSPNVAIEIEIDILPRLVNKAAFADTTSEDCLKNDFIDEFGETEGASLFTTCETLYGKYLSSGVCEKNGAVLYDTLNTVVKTGAEAYKSGSGGSDAYFDYYENYLQEMSAFYTIAQQYSDQGNIVIIVTVEDGVVTCDVSPSSANPRND